MARAVLLGGLTVGVLDILDAFIFFWVRSGTPPERILQSIAAGAVGRESAVAGGASTAALGLALHFFIAMTIAFVAVTAARLWPRLAARPFVTGPIYGLVVYAVMNFVVIPLSGAAGRGGLPPAPVLVNGLLIHIFGVGIPAMWFARNAARS